VILLLDSEPVVRAVMKEALERAGYVVVATGGLGAAVDRLSEGGIDLLITRPYVDNITGHDAARYLLERNPKMGVLVIAGLLDDHRLRDRAAIERFEVFPPPFTADQMLAKVKEVLKATRERAARA
jgi:DNA-binding NtrC family response regulator